MRYVIQSISCKYAPSSYMVELTSQLTYVPAHLWQPVADDRLIWIPYLKRLQLNDAKKVTFDIQCFNIMDIR